MLLVAALAAMVAPATDILPIALALFLLGLGWNFGFVSGSALLSTDIPQDRRARLQGICDSMIWASAALASAVSGLIFSGMGYLFLCLLGALLLILPVSVMLRYRRPLVDSAASHTP